LASDDLDHFQGCLLNNVLRAFKALQSVNERFRQAVFDANDIGSVIMMIVEGALKTHQGFVRFTVVWYWVFWVQIAFDLEIWVLSFFPFPKEIFHHIVFDFDLGFAEWAEQIATLADLVTVA
jgi:hypothetical protein